MKRLIWISFIFFAIALFSFAKDYTPPPLFIDITKMEMAGNQKALVTLVAYINEEGKGALKFQESILPKMKERFINVGSILYAESAMREGDVIIYINGNRYVGNLNFEELQQTIYQALAHSKAGPF